MRINVSFSLQEGGKYQGMHAVGQCGPTFSYPRANQILV
jgi:hypothetical protein